MSRYRLSLIFTVLKMKLNRFWWKRYLSQLTVAFIKTHSHSIENMKSIFFSSKVESISFIRILISSSDILLCDIYTFTWWLSMIDSFVFAVIEWFHSLPVYIQSTQNTDKIAVFYKKKSLLLNSGTRKNFYAMIIIICAKSNH